MAPGKVKALTSRVNMTVYVINFIKLSVILVEIRSRKRGVEFYDFGAVRVNTVELVLKL